MEYQNRIKMCHTNKGQAQDENKLQKQVKKHKVQQLSNKAELINTDSEICSQK